MSSERKLASARANGARSQGPKTPEGRKNSALGPTTHALLARTVCLTNEDEPAFIEMLEEYGEHFQPAGPVERDLIEAMVVAKWQERRIWTIQTAALDLRMDAEQSEVDQKFKQLDQPTRLAIAFGSEADKSRSLALLLRYGNSHRRAYEKSLDLLLKLQGAHGSSLVPAPADAPTPGPLVAEVADLPKTPDPPFTKEPNPTIEHPVRLTICPACGRTVSPNWNTCGCGKILRS